MKSPSGAGPLFARRATYRGAIRHADFFVTRRLRSFLARAIDEAVRSGHRVLDVGCGEQPLRERVEAAGASYVGLDVTQNASRTVAVVGSVLELPFDADRFDVVICSEVLEHVPEPRQALAEIARVLVPGGRLVLSTPFLYPLHESPYDYFRYTPFFYDYAAREVGLQLIESRKLGSALEAAATIADYALTPAPDASALLKLLGNAARIPLNAATGLIVWLLSLDEGRVTFTGIGAVLGKRRV